MIRRLLMTADAVGGVWTYALTLADALAAHDVRVALAVMGPPPSAAQRAEAAALRNVVLHHRPYRLEWMDDPWNDVEAAGTWLLDLAARWSPDVVHLNGYCHAALQWPVPVLVTAHSCVLSWWRAVHGTDAPAAWDRYAGDVRRGLQAAACVVAPTSDMLAMITRHYGPLPRTCVIPNGRAAPTGRRPAKEALVFTAGRVWDEAKNVQAVCAAARDIAWPVYIAGDDRGPGARAARHEPATCLGPLSAADVQSWMARAAVYALPARYEPFGLSALEAALAGCALVLGDIPSLREVWSDAAVYVAPDNPRMCASAVSALIDRPGLRREMARRARARGRALTPAAMADRYHLLYRAVRHPVAPLHHAVPA